MEELYKPPRDIGKKITKQKDKQQKTIRSIKDELKKLNQLYISLDGLQNLSDSSIKNIHSRREQSVLNLIRLSRDLNVVTREIKNLQKQYRRMLKT